MAVDSYDPTTGRPIFSDSGAPDIGVDPTAVGIYAADVGNRIIRANLAALDAYQFKRAGLTGYALSEKQEYVCDGSGWLPTVGDTGWQGIGSYNTGWSTEGSDAPQYRVRNGVLYFRGRIDATAAAVNTPFTVALPPAARPSRDTPFLLGSTSGTAATFVMNVGTNGVITVFKGSNIVNDLALAGTPGIPVL